MPVSPLTSFVPAATAAQSVISVLRSRRSADWSPSSRHTKAPAPYRDPMLRVL